LTCADRSTSVPLYFTELPNNNDVHTTSITAVTTRVKTQGYVFQGVVARVFVTQELSTAPLFHLTRILDSTLAVDALYTVSTADRDAVVASGFYTFVDIEPTYIRCKSAEAFRSIGCSKRPRYGILYHFLGEVGRDVGHRLVGGRRD
jgi:hypothetical protein